MSRRAHTPTQPTAPDRADYRICEHCGKRAHASARKARAATRSAGNRIRVYWCEGGSGWHATRREQ